MKNKWTKTHEAKYGGKKGLSEEMKRRRALVKAPGFANMDKDKLAEIASMGGVARWKNKHAKKDTETTS